MKQSESKLSRNDIVTAVAHLIAEQGLENLTMRNIARHVGCSVGTLPHYFDGKEDIVEAALNWSSDRIMKRLSEMPPSEICLANLYQIMSASMPLNDLADTEWRVRLCLWDYAVSNEDTRDAVAAISHYATDILVDLVMYLQSTGEVKESVDPHSTALGIYQMCIGAGFTMLHTPMDTRVEQLKPLLGFIESIRADDYQA